MAVLTFGRVAARDIAGGEPEGIVGLLRETIDGLRTLIVDHIKLGRVELASDLKAYAQSTAVLAVAGGVLAIGYLFGWIAAGFALARLWGAPLAFGGVAALHLLLGAIALGMAVGKIRRTQLMRDSVVEAKTSASALAHPLQGQLEGRAT
jgi:hypothetical protein